MLAISLCSWLAGPAVAQTSSAPSMAAPGWQTSLDIPAGCTDDWKNRDWYLSVAETRNGRLIAAGYTGIRVNGTNLSCAAHVNTIRPMLDLRNADGSPAWAQPYVRDLGQPATPPRAGRFSEAVEMQNGDIAAVGVQGTRLLVGIFDPATGALRQPLLMPVPYAAKGASIREVLVAQPDGSLVGDGFIIGGVAQADRVGSESRDGTEPLDSSNARPAGGAPPGWRIYMLRLDAAGNVLGEVFLDPSDSEIGTAAVARPIYANGTTAQATPTRVAHAPVGTGQVTGYAIVGTDYAATPPNAPNAPLRPSIHIYRITGEPTGIVTAATEAILMQHRGYAGTGVPYCTASLTATSADIPTDLEQSADGTQLLVTTLRNRIPLVSCIVPNNPVGSAYSGEAYLLGFPVGFQTYTPPPGTPPGTPPGMPSAPLDVFVSIFGAGEVRPQLEVAGVDDYVVASSRLATDNNSAQPWTQNRFYLTRLTNTGVGLTRQWEVEFAPPDVDLTNPLNLVNRLACTFGLALTQDGGYVVAGNDDKYRQGLPTSPDVFRPQDHDAILTKLLPQCGFNISAGQTITTAATALKPDGELWNTFRRIRGTVTVAAGATLTIDAAQIQFDDTRAYQLPATPKAGPVNPTRIVVQRGGRLVIRNGARLTSLQPVAGCSPDPGAAARMWDGIIVQGSGNPARGTSNVTTFEQTAANQGTVVIENASIENAHVGVLAGRISYSATTGLPVVLVNDGGGLVTAQGATFLNCHTGISLQAWGQLTTTPTSSYTFLRNNASTVTGCVFRADAPLADDRYKTTANVRYGMQNGIRMLSVDAVAVRGCTFELLEGSAFPVPVPADFRGNGVFASNSGVILIPAAGNTRNTFRNLFTAVTSSNTELNYSAQILENNFVNNTRGVFLTNVVSATVNDNDFNVGRTGDSFPFGLSIYGSYGYEAARNQFDAVLAGTTTVTSTTARALNVSQSDGSDPANPHPNTIYGNKFNNIATGIYVQRGNLGLTLRCNEFTSPISRANVEINIGTDPAAQSVPMNPQGDCFDPNIKPVANFFSQTGTCGTPKDILVTAPAASTLFYNFYNATDTHNGKDMVPSCNVKVTLPAGGNGCGESFNYATDCPNARLRATQTTAQLLAELDTLTNATARAEVIDELLRRYLNPLQYPTGLDSAVALLQTVNDPMYAEQRTALENRGGYVPASRAAVGHGGATTPAKAGRGLLRSRKAETAASATRAAIGNYFEQVRALLAPLGTDSAIAATLKTNGGLRRQLLGIALDTLTWGYGAGQAVLSQYLGYRFRPWYEAGSLVDSTSLLRQAAPSGTEAKTLPAARVSVYPNPTEQAVTLTYALPTEASEGEVQLYDRFGLRRRTLVVRGAEGQAALSLAGLPAGHYHYRFVVGKTVVQTGTLVKLP